MQTYVFLRLFYYLCKKTNDMHYVRLKINNKVYDKLIWLLSKFSSDEVEVIPEDSEFYGNQKYLSAELNEIIKGNANFTEVDDVEQRLENVIKKHEDSI